MPGTLAIPTCWSASEPSHQRSPSAGMSTTFRGRRILPASEVVRVGDVLLYVLHRLEDLDLDPKSAGFAAVIYGHSHQPSSEVRDGILYLNPGSAGPRRFRLPVAIAKIRVVGTNLSPEFIHLRV